VKPHALHPEADAEYEEAVRHYASITPELGNRFYDEIERLIAEASRTPGTFRFIREPARRHFTREFPYGIIYVERPDDIWILAVMPLRRKPGYWQHRLT
jgi:plasmid stabilization system protein ParE